MTKKTNTESDILEMLFQQAALLAEENIGNSIAEPEAVEFSAEHEQKVQKLFKKMRRKELSHKLFVISRRAACVLLVVVAGLAVAVGSVEAWRVKFLNYVFDPEAQNMDVVFGDKGTHYSDDDIILNYLPLGFELTDKKSSRKSNIFTFKSADEYVRVARFDKEVQVNLDTEDAIVEDVIIDGCDGVYVEKDYFKAVIWSDGENIIQITTNVSKNELIKIAENIK